ncbi:MAG: sigma-70 family RNA polymerase sigma factor [Akkermansiaceae bacterium]|nr:sigma-70 family RNA polymerase sigma factor [Akkermansiaceae bacterium]
MSEIAANEESRLISAAQNGDLAAFGILVEHHYAAVRACLAVRMGNAHDAEDLTQEVFLLAFKKLDQCTPGRPMRPWLRRIAVNLSGNHRRKFRALPVGAIEELQNLIDDSLRQWIEPLDERTPLEALRHCLDQLESPARQLLFARYADELSLDELAALLERKTSAVSMQLHRLRHLIGNCIREKLSPQPPTPRPL